MADEDKGFHLHVYWRDAAEREVAMRLRAQLEAQLPGVKMGRIHEQAIAFHPEAFYEVDVATAQLGAALNIVMVHRGPNPVMVHTLDTRDPIRAHTTDALWLGDPLPIDVDVFRRLMAGGPPPA